MNKIDLKKASKYYLIGNLFNKGSAFITVPIFTRILSTTDYGIVTTYNSWISILSIIMGCAIYMGIRAAFIDYKENVDDFMSVSTTFTLICGVIICFIVGGSVLLLEIDLSMTIIMLCLLQGLAASLIQNYSMYLMMQYRYRFRTMIMILPNFLSILFSILAIIFVVKTKVYMGRIIPTALVYIGFGILIALLVYRKSRVLVNGEYLKYGLRISLPLVLHGIALNVLSQSDRTMITLLADASQTGIYSLIYNFSMIATVITTSLDGVWVPWFTDKLMHRDMNVVNKVAKYYILFMTCAMAGIIMVGPEVVKVLASEDYWVGVNIIPPVVLANYLIFAYTFYVNIEHFHKKSLYITINTLVAALSNLILNYLFIPRYGYVAAAYTTLVSYLISLILHSRYSKEMEPSLYPISIFTKSLIHLFIVCTIFYLFIDMWLIRWGGMTVYLLLMAYKNRLVLIEFFGKGMKKQ